MHTFGQSKVSYIKMLSALFLQGDGFCLKSSHVQITFIYKITTKQQH